MSSTISSRLIFAISMALAFGADALAAGCDNEPNESQRLSCLTAMLLQADDRLNDVYQRRLSGLPQVERDTLVKAQRQWISFRNTSCQFSEQGLRDRSEWLSAAVSDAKRADCLIQHTLDRTRQLIGRDSGGEPAKGPVLASEVRPSVPTAAYSVKSARVHRYGKYYFEVVIDHGNIQGVLEADVQARIRAGSRFLASTYSIRPQDQVIRMEDGGSITIAGGNLGNIRLPRKVIGIAVDLDSRQFFRHHDGRWRGSTPAQGKGLALPPADQFFAEVVTSVSIAPLLTAKVLTVNFGESPFAFAPPAGYLAFDSVPPDPITAAAAVRATVAPDALIDGHPISEWTRRYWHWVRSFPANETPSDDGTGARCNAGQAGPVFFLTGSRGSKPVSRVCTVPKDKHVLVPMINVLAQAQASSASKATCEDLLRSAREVNESAADLSLSLNGTPIQVLESHKVESGCFELRDTSRGTSGRAAGAGYWVVIEPLKSGAYELAFSARYRRDGFAQDVRYRLAVE